MRACWREGIVPLLQMHDALECSVSTREQAEMVAQLGVEAIKLRVPMRIDLKFGCNWGDTKHNWEELHGAAPSCSPVAEATASSPTSPETSSSRPRSRRRHRLPCRRQRNPIRVAARCRSRVWRAADPQQGDLPVPRRSQAQLPHLSRPFLLLRLQRERRRRHVADGSRKPNLSGSGRGAGKLRAARPSAGR